MENYRVSRTGMPWRRDKQDFEGETLHEELSAAEEEFYRQLTLAFERSAGTTIYLVHREGRSSRTVASAEVNGA